MFFYEKIPFTTFLMFIFVVAVLVLLNEITRRSLKLSLLFYLLVPAVLTIFVWPNTSGSGSSTGYWFAWVKTFSALAGVLGFLIIRFKKGVSGTKFAIFFPAFILGFNILEACYRDLESMSLNGVFNDTIVIGGPWNVMNAIAGLISIITITGYTSIMVSKSKSKDMIWPDMMWFWIIAYDVWNIAYCYNSIADRSLWSGVALIVACTFAEFFIKKGAWLEHRARTLALYAMFTLTIPSFAATSQFAVKSSQSTTALFVLSLASLVLNIAVLVYMIYRVRIIKKNPYTNPCYSHLKAYQEVIKENS